MNNFRIFFFGFLLFSSLTISAPLELSIGLEGMCASPREDELYCWGRGTNGQIPIGEPSADLVTPLKISLHEREKLVRLSQSANSNSFCGVFDQSRVKCWGNNAGGQLGLGTASQVVGNGFNQELWKLPYIDLGGDFAAQEIIMGLNHSCAIAATGKVKCWGNNNAGQLGLGDTKLRGKLKTDMGSALPYVDLGPGVVVTQMCLGEQHTCALLNSGELKCWGSNLAHGGGTTANLGSTPTHMGVNLKPVNLDGEKVKKVACGLRHTCALLQNGTVKCFGQNSVFGTLGHENASSTVIGDSASEMGKALPETKLSNDLEVIDLSCGTSHCCALIENSAVKCWGAGQQGQLGLGDATNRGGAVGQMGDNLPFVDLGNLAQVEAIQLGGNDSCATLANGDVKCWGLNNNGQLGNGTKTNVGMSPGQMGANLKPLVMK